MEIREHQSASPKYDLESFCNVLILTEGGRPGDPTQVRVRKVGEIITNTLGAVVGPAVNYPLGTE